MTNTAVTTSQSFSQRQVSIMKATVANGLSDAEFAFFLEVCKHRKLNPFNREIYAFSGKNGKVTIQVSIDGLRLLAERSGKYRGQLGPYWCGPDGQWREEWLEKSPPAAAKVGVLRSDFDKPVWAVARYDSYAQNSPVWQKMPDLMISKCAESLALRRAFPDQMSGLYSHEEMEQSGNVPMVATVESIAPQSHRLNALDQKGRAKGHWSSQAGMFSFISSELGVNVNRDTIYELNEEQIDQLESAVEQESAVVVSAGTSGK